MTEPMTEVVDRPVVPENQLPVETIRHFIEDSGVSRVGLRFEAEDGSSQRMFGVIDGQYGWLRQDYSDVSSEGRWVMYEELSADSIERPQSIWIETNDIRPDYTVGQLEQFLGGIGARHFREVNEFDPYYLQYGEVNVDKAIGILLGLLEKSRITPEEARRLVMELKERNQGMEITPEMEAKIVEEFMADHRLSEHERRVIDAPSSMCIVSPGKGSYEGDGYYLLPKDAEVRNVFNPTLVVSWRMEYAGG